MLLKITFLLCAFLASHGLARTELSRPARGLKQFSVACILNDPDVTIAVARAEVESVGGVVTAHVVSTSSAVEEATDAIVNITAQAIVNVAEGGDAMAIADGAGTATGEAIAEAYASSTAFLTSDGADNSACIEGFASASATATAFARAFIEILAQASNVIAFADSQGAASALSIATASAFAEVEISACGEGVFDISIEADILGSALAQPIAEVFGVALAIVSGDSAVGQILVEASSDVLEVSVIEGAGFIDVDGEGNGTADAFVETCTTQQDPCQSIRLSACCADGREECTCGTSCEARRADFNDDSIIAYLILESDQTAFSPLPPAGEVCFCT